MQKVMVERPYNFGCCQKNWQLALLTPDTIGSKGDTAYVTRASLSPALLQSRAYFDGPECEY